MMFRRLFGPSNSLVLLYDHLTPDSRDEMEAQITEVRAHYRFVRLREMSASLRSGNAKGLATVAFKSARKSFQMYALPFLKGEEIPFTVFLRPDCIGLNRLPPEEELRAYADEYPDKLASSRLPSLEQEAWNDPDAIETFLLACRREIGPLPIEKMDPMVFFGTWGKLIDVPPNLREFGLNVYTKSPPHLIEAMTTIRRHGEESVVSAYCAHENFSTTASSLGLEILVTNETGAITSKTNPLEVPSWRFETADPR